MEIQGWLYRAKGPSRGLIVQVHGGPTAHSEAALSAFIQSAVAAGFSVLDPNYRGSTGFGVAFREAIRKTGWGGLEQDDIRPYSEEMMGGSPAMAPERYRERSPIHSVERIKGRLLIVQGANDPNVTPENVRVVEAALKRAGVPYEALVFADEGHGVRKPENLRVLYARLIEFFGDAFAGSDARS